MESVRFTLNRIGQAGLVFLILSTILAVFSSGLAGLAEVYMGVLGFYLLTHRRPPQRLSKPSSKKEVKP